MKLTAFLALLMLAGIAGLGRHLYMDGWSADELYRRAERLYQAGDFEKAKLLSEKALKIDSRHAPARALSMEVQFILWQGKALSNSGCYDRCGTSSGPVRHQQIDVEIDNALYRGCRAERSEDVEQARREYRKVIEYAKWLPESAELLARVQEARVRLDDLR